MLTADRTIQTTCPYCGVGCQIDLLIKDDLIFRVNGRFDNDVNHGNLCVKGRFGYDYVYAPDRLTQPLVRQGRKGANGHKGVMRPASWDEALDTVAGRLCQIRNQHGPDAIAILTSAKCTNEENYLLQKYARAIIGTNNVDHVDHCACLPHGCTVAGLVMTVGLGAMTNSIRDIVEADVLLVTGSNTTEAHPVLSLQMKKAVRQFGAKLILVDPRRIELANFATIHLRQEPGSDAAIFNAMAHVIIEEGLANHEFVAERTEGYEALADALRDWTPQRAAAISGTEAEDIAQAARLYAQAERGAIFWAMGISQHASGADNVLALSNLALLTGHIGRPGTGLNPLRGQNNAQGACDMGGLPYVFPGYQPVTSEEVRRKFSAGWGVPFEALSPAPGLTARETMEAALDGEIRAIFIIGENPMMSDADLHHVEMALQRVEFLVVQDLFVNETAQMADVVLPAVSFAEKSGTFTSTERRVQLVRPALAPFGQARPDWQIIVDLANRWGANWQYAGPSAVFDEMAGLTPLYGGLSHSRLEGGGLQWPCPTADHPGTRVLHAGNFVRGKGLFCPVEYAPPAEGVDEEYPFILSTGRVLYHWHGGTMSRRSPGLDTIAPEAEVEINPKDARKLNIQDQELVRVRSRRGEVIAAAKVTRRSPPGTVFMAFHFAEAAANLLTTDAADSMAKTPEYKVCAVHVEAVRSNLTTKVSLSDSKRS